VRPSDIEVHAVAPLNVVILVQRRNGDSDVVCGLKVVVDWCWKYTLGDQIA